MEKYFSKVTGTLLKSFSTGDIILRIILKLPKGYISSFPSNEN